VTVAVTAGRRIKSENYFLFSFSFFLGLFSTPGTVTVAVTAGTRIKSEEYIRMRMHTRV